MGISRVRLLIGPKDPQNTGNRLNVYPNVCSQGWLNSIIFIGMMVGAYAWGSVADTLGRKRVLIAISIVNALAIVASSFSQNYELFLLFRFINGAA